MILKNKGMLLEEVINNSINQDGNDYILEKVPTGNKIISSFESELTKVKLLKSNFCDYVGLYKGRYIEIEAKETELEYFNISNISKSQIEKLKLVSKNNGLGLLFIYFHIKEKIYFVHINDLLDYKSKKIPLSWFEENCNFECLDNYYIEIKKVFDSFNNY